MLVFTLLHARRRDWLLFMGHHPAGAPPLFLTPGLTPANARSFSSPKGPASVSSGCIRTKRRPEPLSLRPAAPSIFECSYCNKHTHKTKRQAGDNNTRKRHTPTNNHQNRGYPREWGSGTMLIPLVLKERGTCHKYVLPQGVTGLLYYHRRQR